MKLKEHGAFLIQYVIDFADGEISRSAFDLDYSVVSQILCKHHFRCKIEQNIFKAGAAQAASALPTK